ncbi:MAG: ThiF family adenylyltransferase [Candidatus Izemoplasmataceae bacterium]
MLKDVLEILDLNGYNPIIEDKKIIIHYKKGDELLRAYFKTDINYYDVPNLYTIDNKLIYLTGLSTYGNRFCLFTDEIIPNANHEAEIYLEVANRLKLFLDGELNHEPNKYNEIYEFWGKCDEYGYIRESCLERISKCKLSGNILKYSETDYDSYIINIGKIDDDFDFDLFQKGKTEKLIQFIETVIEEQFDEFIKDILFIGLLFDYKDEMIEIGLEVGYHDYKNIILKPFSIPISNFSSNDMKHIRLVRTDFEYLSFRSGSGNEKCMDDNILFIGCGSLGSSLVKIFSEKGYSNFTLIDKEKLSVSNVNRHLCSYKEINKYKTEGVKSFLTSKYQYVKVETINEDVLYFDGLKDKIENASLVVITVGTRNVEQYLSYLLGKENIPYIISFVEPYLTAGHMIVCKGIDCFDTRIFNETLDFTSSVIKNEGYSLREFGCTSSFNQYGFYDLNKFLYLSFNILEDFVYGNCNVHICCPGDLKKSIESGAKVKFAFLDTQKSWQIKVEDI